MRNTARCSADPITFYLILSQVTIIYSGSDSFNVVVPTDSSNVVTTVEDYREICTLTGGLFVPSDKVR